ncbi:hypothetical protein SAMN05216532_0271 [Streptomyces sp. 2231.1]|nr:hypothetical protein SAMN05216532_0271 [Streptomyces sp. 2231.1]
MSAAGVGLGPAPLVNIWNPAGWVIAPAMAAGSLSYVGGRLLSRFGLGQGAKRREAARVESRQAAHRAVRAHSPMSVPGWSTTGSGASRRAPGCGSPLVAEALSVRRISADAARDSGLLLCAAGALSVSREPAAVLDALTYSGNTASLGPAAKKASSVRFSYSACSSHSTNEACRLQQ